MASQNQDVVFTMVNDVNGVYFHINLISFSNNMIIKKNILKNLLLFLAGWPD